MPFEPILPEQKDAFNKAVGHPLQSYEWGVFREKSGVKVIRRGVPEGKSFSQAFQITIHPVPRTTFTIGYLPKGEAPTTAMLEELEKIGKEENCIFIQLEPNLSKDNKISESKDTKITSDAKAFNTLISQYPNISPSAHPLFTKYTFVLNLNRSEEEILKGMHQKTRYNIRVAEKHNVEIKEDTSEDAFRKYWELTEVTTKRQKFYAHTKKYHELQWETFPHTTDTDTLTSHLFTATYDGKILTTMLFFVFKDTLYYPYGASSHEYRNTMHSVLTMWEGIKFGKKLGLKKFDMWGSLSENPDPNDPWFGFHRFKQGYGPELVEFVGSYDLVINPAIYEMYKVADKLRWMYLKLKK